MCVVETNSSQNLTTPFPSPGTGKPHKTGEGALVLRCGGATTPFDSLSNRDSQSLYLPAKDIKGKNQIGSRQYGKISGRELSHQFFHQHQNLYFKSSNKSPVRSGPLFLPPPLQILMCIVKTTPLKLLRPPFCPRGQENPIKRERVSPGLRIWCGATTSFDYLFN
ncbi:hypothetical protein CDAR_275231 [Caerostris darwini]|uniref:Uncharacterized protein n=1 Tax=Caerostris darwini TaxID=1538125 RepID=A0AAV4VWC9_9ARAC|nr:hypothetical protein CDAR_275231 [Caerostris darwini]